MKKVSINENLKDKVRYNGFIDKPVLDDLKRYAVKLDVPLTHVLEKALVNLHTTIIKNYDDQYESTFHNIDYESRSA